MRDLNQHSLHLIPMTLEHLDRVLQIEAQSFPQPYSREIFLEELALEIAHPCVLLWQGEVVGFIDYWCVKDELHVISLAVAPEFRRRGFGNFLMNHLEESVRERKVQRIILDVRESNAAALHLYEKFNYQVVGRRRRYYSDNNEDALVMEKQV